MELSIAVRRLRILATGVCVSLMLVAPAASAAPGTLTLRPGMGGVADLGAARCETFNAMYPAGPSGLRQAVLYWMEGFVYARSGKGMEAFLAGRNDASAWTFETLTGHVVDFCVAQPEATVADAVSDLWGRLGI